MKLPPVYTGGKIKNIEKENLSKIQNVIRAAIFYTSKKGQTHDGKELEKITLFLPVV
jgi:hypothetical protein